MRKAGYHCNSTLLFVGVITILVLPAALSAQEYWRVKNQSSSSAMELQTNSGDLSQERDSTSRRDDRVDPAMTAPSGSTRSMKSSVGDFRLPNPRKMDVPLNPPRRYYWPAMEADVPPGKVGGVPALNASAESKRTAEAGGVGQDLFEQAWKLAAQPELGDRRHVAWPQTDRCADLIDPIIEDFSPTPVFEYQPYDPEPERLVYEGKTLNANRRPLVELGKPWYQLGQLQPSATWLGSHNPVSPQFLVYGDFRTAYAGAKTLDREHISELAFLLNLNFDLRLTATERITAFVAPLDRGGSVSRWLLDEDRFDDNLDFDVAFGMFEGDLGALWGGFVGQTLPFDLPFAIGVMPMVVQNGIWMDDAITGVAATIPARHSTTLDISNMDITFFAAYDEIDSPAFEGNNSAARMYGVLSFIEMFGGYWELDYAFLDDRDFVRDRSYHNIGIAFSRRYGRFISNSVRVIGNAGQSTQGGDNTADGVLLLIENSLITSQAQTFVPYLNMWAGFDRPQSAARAAVAGGILRNTGILFEGDGMSAFPTLDPTANDTWGGSLGVNILTPNLDQQLVLEATFLKTMGNDATRVAPGDQAGVGARYQIPLTNALILRTDLMYGFLQNTPDVNGARLELRYKF